MRVFFYEAFEEEADELRRALPPAIRAGFTRKTVQEQKDASPPAPLISVRTQSVIPPAWTQKLTGILTRSTGYDHIVKYLKTVGKDIPCGHLPLYCSRAVAEYALLMMLSLARRLPEQVAAFDRFRRDGLTGIELEGKNLLVVGVGNIGSEMVKIGRGLGMHVKGVDVVKKHDWVDYTGIDQGIGWADFIVCAMNLTAENNGYFNRDLLNRAKQDAVFVNIARGEFSPARDLLELLDKGKLGGIGLDVFNNEPELAVSLRSNKPSDSPETTAVLELAKRPNVILTPHNAFNTKEAVAKKAVQSVEQVESFLKNGRFLWPVP
jgi:D-lactate dehydrogenase